MSSCHSHSFWGNRAATSQYQLHSSCADPATLHRGGSLSVVPTRGPCGGPGTIMLKRRRRRIFNWDQFMDPVYHLTMVYHWVLWREESWVFSKQELGLRCCLENLCKQHLDVRCYKSQQGMTDPEELHHNIKLNITVQQPSWQPKPVPRVPNPRCCPLITHGDADTPVGVSAVTEPHTAQLRRSLLCSPWSQAPPSDRIISSQPKDFIFPDSVIARSLVLHVS